MGVNGKGEIAFYGSDWIDLKHEKVLSKSGA
jgi:hypothetical protein